MKKFTRFLAFMVLGLLVCVNSAMGQNLSLAGTATASSENGGNVVAAAAIDGDAGTRWESEHLVDPQWLIVELDADYTLTSAVISWEGANASDYTIDISLDGTTWTTVNTQTGLAGGARTDNLTLSGDARYVRMNGTARNGDWGYSIWEFEIYGTPVGQVSVLTTIELSAAKTRVPINTDLTITATGYDQDGYMMATTPSWSTSDAVNSTVTDGVFSATVPGTYTITADDGGITDDIEITVTQPQLTFTSATASEGNAANAIDGNFGSQWEGNGSTKPWIYADLGQLFYITNLDIYWEGASAEKYAIDISANGINWQNIDSLKNGADGARLDEFIPNASAQYIRINCLIPTVVGYGFKIFEIEAFGIVDGSIALTTLNVNAEETTIPANYGLQLFVEGFDQNTNPHAVTPVWSVDKVNGSVSAEGVFTATAPGVYEVTCIDGTVSNTISITATAPQVLSRIEITPASADVTLGDDQQFAAQGYDQSDLPMATTITWSVDGGGTIDPSTGLFSSTTLGDYTVTAEEGAISATAAVSVKPENLALSQTVVASSGDANMDLAVDGDLGSRWESAFTDPQWIYVDLGSTKYLHEYVLNWQEAAASDYTIDISADGVNWQTIHTISDIEANPAGRIDNVEQQASAQYIRMYGTERTTGYGYSLFEFEVLGVDLPGGTVLNSITVDADATVMHVGDSVQFYANGFDAGSVPFATAPIWTVSSTDAEVSLYGMFKSDVIGTYTVTATDGAISNTFDIEVNAAPVIDSIVISPETATIFIDETQQFSAVAYDQYDELIDATFTWDAESGTVVDGLFTPSVAGDIKVYAESNSVQDSALITVLALPELTTIVVSPASAVIPEGGSQVFTAVGYDQYGDEFAFTPVWSANVGTIDAATGEYTHDVAGNYVVTATGGTVTGTANISVSDVPELSTIVITPADASIMQGEEQQYTAAGFDQFGDPFTATYTWSADGGTIDPSTGLYSATTVGEYSVTATSGSISNSVDITVTEIPVVTTIVLSPATATIVADETQQFTAVAYDQFDNEIASTFTWSAESGTVVDGLYTPSTDGIFEVYAESNSVTGTAVITVTQVPVVTTIVLSPATATIVADETQQFTAVAYDQFDNEIATTFTWSAESGTVVDGLYTPSTDGIFEVYAESNSVTGTAVIAVTPVLVVDSIAISPESATIVEDETQQFTAVAYDQFGDVIVTTFTWSAESGTVVDGLFTPSTDGIFEVYAASNSVTGTAVITVTQVPVVDSIAISPETAIIVVDETQQFTAVAYDQFGDEIATTFTWSAESGTVVDGLYTPATDGEFKVYVASGSVEDSAIVIVTQVPVITSIVVSPETATITDSETQQFSAVAYDQFDNEIAATITWSATGGTVVDGLFTPSAVGDASVIATSGSVSGSADITVTETLVLTSIVINPDGITLTTGETQQFIAVGYDQNDDEIDATIVFSVDGTGSIVDGLYTAADVGTDNVVATSGTVTASVVVTIEGTESISSSSSINVKMFPNPVSSLLTIDMAEHSCNTVALLNSNGQIVYQQNNIQSESNIEIDVKDWPSGVYVVILEDDLTSYSYTISKQ